MKELDRDQVARLEKLREAIAEEEPGLAAAIEAYNAAVRAAYRELSDSCGPFSRVLDKAISFHSEVELDIQVAVEEAKDRGRDEEGRRLRDWLDAWRRPGTSLIISATEPPKQARRPDTPISAVIAALPRRPEEVAKRAADDPAVKASVMASWHRIDAWLARNAPFLAEQMNPGASPEAIAKAEAALGVELPDAVRASYAIHDGSDIMSLFPSGDYLSLEQMVGQYDNWRDTEEEERAWMDGYDPPKGPVRLVHYHLKWIPLTDWQSGDHTVIDLAPAEGGVVGQLVDFSHETGPECVAAPGLAEYLSYLADGMEAGAATIGEETYLIWNVERDTPRSGYVLPSTGVDAGRPGAGGSARRYFEFKGGSSSKFWEITREGTEMSTRYGKIGTKGSSTTKTFETDVKAEAETAKIIAKKVKEGYVEKWS